MAFLMVQKTSSLANCPVRMRRRSNHLKIGGVRSVGSRLMSIAPKSTCLQYRLYWAAPRSPDRSMKLRRREPKRSGTLISASLYRRFSQHYNTQSFKVCEVVCETKSAEFYA